jgi:peptide/nickel transport system substrate-binding protein
MFTLGYAKGANWNATYWDDDRFNELLIAARGELDEAKRREMYVEMQLRLRDEGGVIIPIFMNHIYAISKNVMTADQQAGNFELDGNRCCERWWFA